MQHAATHTILASIVLTAGLAGCKKADPPAPQPSPQPTTPTQQTVSPGTGDPALAPIAGAYELDPAHSAVGFAIKHLEVSHTLGRFNKVSGSLTIDGDPAKSKVEIVVDAASVFTADKKRDDHLRSPDFLNVAQFPKITFTSTAIERAGDSFEVTGDLELHGVKKSVTTTLALVGSGKHPMDPSMFLVGFTGDLAIKRTEFGLTNMVPVAGDDIKLTIAIEAGKKL